MEPLRLSPRATLALRATSVTMLFGETVALWDVDLEGRSGDLLVVHGGNGSGKSTLLRIVAGLLAPTRGQVGWRTQPGSLPTRAMLGHATHLFDELAVAENVALAARLAGADEELGIRMLHLLGVAGFAGRRAGTLSAGTRRRVGLARAIATQPDVLIVDEPFSGLDVAAADLVAEVLASLRDEGRLVLAAAHDDTRTRSMATRSVRLEAGRVVPSATARSGADAR